MALVPCTRETCCWEDKPKDEACHHVAACGCAIVKHPAHPDLLSESSNFRKFVGLKRRTSKWKELHSVEVAKAAGYDATVELQRDLVQRIGSLLSSVAGTLDAMAGNLRSCVSVEDATPEELKTVMSQVADQLEKLKGQLG